MSSFTQTGANGSLSYSGGVANVRMTAISYDYTINSTESQARRARAFYPHLRSQGTFGITIQCKGWREANQLNQWLLAYADALLDLSTAKMPPAMRAVCSAYDLNRVGIPISGMEMGDHVGSLLFNPTLGFISISDPNDPSTAILSLDQASAAIIPTGVEAQTNYMYPSSVVNYPGKLDQYIYDQYTGPPPMISPTKQAHAYNPDTF